MKMTYLPSRLVEAALKTQFSARLKSTLIWSCLGLLAALSENPSARGADAAATNAGGKTAEAVTPAPGRETRATLIEAGTGARKTLRLHSKAGDKRTATVNLKMGMDMQIGGGDGQVMKMPAMKTVMNATVKSVSPQGDLAYETVITDASVADESDAMPQMVEAMKATIEGLKGLSVTGTVSKRGLNLGTEVKTPADTNPQLRQALEQMKDALSNLGVVLPEEPIGLGAKWEVKQTIKSQGMTLDQTTTYELISLDGDRLTAKTTLAQVAANQQIQNPAIPGATIDLIKLASKGTGEVVLDLGFFVPVRATLNLHNESNMSIDTGGQKIRAVVPG